MQVPPPHAAGEAEALAWNGDPITQVGQETPFLGELSQWNLKSLLVMIRLKPLLWTEFLCSLKFICWSLTPGVMVFGGNFGRWFGPEGGAFVKRIVVVQLLSRFWLFVTPIDCSTPGFPVLHYLLEFAQIHVRWVGYPIWPSHPLPPPSPFAFILSQHQSLFQSVGSLHQVAKVLELQVQHQSFQWVFRVDFL